MLKYAACTLGSCLGMIQSFGLGIYHLDGHFSPQGFFKHKFCLNVGDMRAEVQGNTKAVNAVRNIWVILDFFNQGLSSLMGIICRFKL